MDSMLTLIYARAVSGCLLSVEQEKSSQIQVVKTSTKTLNEPERYVAENLLTSRQCSSLIYLAKLFAMRGDGYENNKGPHSPKEWFGGIALSRLAFLVRLGLVDLHYLKTIVHVTDQTKDHIEKHFNLPKDLYFSYTHLVCRSAVVGIPIVSPFLGYSF